MPVFDVSINILVVLPLLIIAALAGFLIRSGQLRRKKRQINELEREMMQAYAELLETQKDYAELKARLKNEDSPVISITETKSQESANQPLPCSTKVRKNGSAS
jgi:multidrug efflux pump subunit AcrA (membrane-fusion protein)